VKDHEPDLESTMIDLTRVPLARLRELDDSVLARSLRRLLEADTSESPIASWDSSI